MTTVYILIAAVVGIGIGILIANTILKNALTKRSQQLLKNAEEKGEIIKKEKILQAKEKFLQLNSEYEKNIQERNSVVAKNENRLKQKEQVLNQRLEEVAKKENENNQLNDTLKGQMSALDKKRKEVEINLSKSVEQLEKISGMTAEQAKKQLIDSMKEEAMAEAAVTSREIIDEAKLSANAEAKKIVIETIQRTATENAIENSVSVFHIDNDEVKGRIIGREGRNIKALESLTGVEIIIDDSPETIILSGFDPVRREIARLSLHKLVTDGRIHPARIEEVVAKTEKQIEQEILEIGKRTCIDLGIHGINIELIRLVGKMRYRSSYGQNLLQHSIEVANLCATMAAEQKDTKAMTHLEEMAAKVKESFVETFVNEYGYLLDYVDGTMMDWSVRPNMIFAVALDYSPLSQQQMKSVVDICTRELLTPKGLRSLSPKSGGYNPIYVGPQTQRDYAYHQGTAWPWLGGFYMEACLKLYKRSRLSFIERQLVGYEDEMDYHALGTISELFDGNPPFHGRGAMSFAMNVAEILRTLKLMDKYSYQK